MAMVIDPEQAKTLMKDLRNCLKAKAGTIILYMSPDSPRGIDTHHATLKDFPAPGMIGADTLFTIGVENDYDAVVKSLQEVIGAEE